MASIHKDTQSLLAPYIKALASYGKTLPAAKGASSPALRPSGVQIRSKEPNVQTPTRVHPSGRPPAEHIVRLLVKSMTTGGIKYKPGGVSHIPSIKAPVIHPGKALALKSVKKIHLGSTSVKKVTL